MAKGKRDGKVTQKAMVEAALSDKGWEAPPLELQASIKEKYGVEMPTNYISNYKSQLKSAGAKDEAKPAGAKRGRKPKAAGLQFADLEAVRGLVDRLGSAQVKELVAMAEKFD